VACTAAPDAHLVFLLLQKVAQGRHHNTWLTTCRPNPVRVTGSEGRGGGGGVRGRTGEGRSRIQCSHSRLGFRKIPRISSFPGVRKMCPGQFFRPDLDFTHAHVSQVEIGPNWCPPQPDIPPGAQRNPKSTPKFPICSTGGRRLLEARAS
jgi:hypothetical protein